jgi:nitroreductase/Pyruvate/2-oxoacid:ferredoxin oxidoreductase delta subunit
MGVMTSQGPVTGAPVIDVATCTVCGTCTLACPAGVLEKGDGAIHVDRDAGLGCVACGHCAMACPTGSIRVSGRGFAMTDLVDLPAPGLRPTADQVEALLLARRSIRRFKADPVPREILERLVAAAALAPVGLPPWEVGVVVYDTPEKVRALADVGAAEYEGLLKVMDNRVVRPLLNLHPNRQVRGWFQTFLLPLAREIAGAREKGEDRLLHGAAACLLFHSSAHADPVDAALACTAAMVEAEALGLGSCMIGALPGPLARSRDAMRRVGIPEGHVAKLALILGWPAITYRRTVRRALASVTWR